LEYCDGPIKMKSWVHICSENILKQSFSHIRRTPDSSTIYLAKFQLFIRFLINWDEKPVY
jgi:hypothetical protein